MTSTEDPARLGTYRTRLTAILLLAYALRVVLAFQGGQLFWADESRYFASRLAAAALAHGQWHEALVQLFGHADHVLFRLVCLPPAIAETLLGSPHPVLVSCYISLFSVGSIGLCGAIALRAGASEREALWSAFFAAASNGLFYYSRHFLPYDISLFIMLCALWVALGRYSGAHSFRVGVVVGLGFLTYNGYWLLGAAVLAVHLIFGEGDRRLLRRGILSVLGLFTAIACVVAVGVAVSPGLLAEYRSFSGTVKQGDFHIGYRVMAEFLWHAEGGMLLVWAGVFLAGALAPGQAGEGRRLRMWATGIVVIVAGLVFFSDVVPRFMVYGRLTRTILPFVCLCSGAAAVRLFRASGRAGAGVAGALAVLTVGLAALGFAQPLMQDFPDRFRKEAVQTIASQRRQGFGFFRLVDAETLWGRRLDEVLPPHEELLRKSHPMQYRPFQYEGYSAELRDQLNSHDVSMRVVETPFQAEGAPDKFGGYPGPVRMRLMLRPEYWGQAVPLLATGVTGKGDLFILTYLDPGHITLALDHWDGSELISEPVAVDYDKPHDLVVSGGSLLPPAGSSLYSRFPQYEGLTDRFVAKVDGQTVISKQSAFYPSTPETIYTGQNAIGASTSEPILNASVLGFGSEPLDDVATAVPSMAAFALAERRSPEWNGALGPLRIRFAMAAPTPPVTAEPLISFKGAGTKDVVYVRREGAGKVRIGFDRMGAGAILSEPMELEGGGRDELDVSLGSLLPAASSNIYSEYPGFAAFRNKVYIRFNSRPAIEADVAFTPLSAAGVTIGANTIGTSTYSENFKGTISYFDSIGPENIPGVGTRLAQVLDNPDPAWGGFTGPVSVKLVFPDARPGSVEPLMVNGSEGRSEALFIEYGEGGTARFGYSRTHVPPIYSHAVHLPSGPQELTLSSGALMPGETSEIYPNALPLDALRSFVHLGLNGVPLLHEYAVPEPAGRDSVWIGADPFTHPLAGARFTGTIQAITRIPPMDIFAQGQLGPKYARAGWGGYPGPLEIVALFGAGIPGTGEPLVTTGLRGIGDVLYLRYEASGKARICEDHWGSQLLVSDAFALDLSRPHTFVVSMGALYPEDALAPKADLASISALREKTIVIVDGKTVLSAAEPRHPSTPDHIMVGVNLIGSSTAVSLFSGTIERISPAPLPQFGP